MPLLLAILAAPRVCQRYFAITVILDNLTEGTEFLWLSPADNCRIEIKAQSNHILVLFSPSCSQLETGWNIDLQELEYNPSKKDLTDARIHHLLAEELCKPYKRVNRL